MTAPRHLLQVPLDAGHHAEAERREAVAAEAQRRLDAAFEAAKARLNALRDHDREERDDA